MSMKSRLLRGLFLVICTVPFLLSCIAKQAAKSPQLMVYDKSNESAHGTVAPETGVAGGVPGGTVGGVIGGVATELQQASEVGASLESRKIICTGSLELLVRDVPDAAGKIRGTASSLGGFVEKSSQADTGGITASIVMRVPAERFDQAMAEIKRGAVRVESENVEARDVTREYIDLDARLRNARAQEAQYLLIMKRATTVKDTLEVSEKLGEARQNVEQLQGEMKYMTTQIAMSSIEISLRAEPQAVAGIHWRPLYQAKTAALEMVSGLADWVDTIVVFIIKLPLILVWLVTIVVIAALAWRVVRWLWKQVGDRIWHRLPWLRRARGEAKAE
jgi:hypothetical protein